MSSTLHPNYADLPQLIQNYTDLPQLTQNFFEFLQHSAVPSAVHVMELVLVLGQWWDIVRKGWTVLALPSPLPSCEPLQIPEQHHCFKGKSITCSPFYPLETWSDCLHAEPGARKPVFIKLTAALNLSPALSDSLHLSSLVSPCVRVR